MNIIVSLTTFSLMVLLYLFISELFTILFRFTGLPDERARFQVISMLTGCGFTTHESEMLLTTKTRRRMARYIMLFGYVFNITIVSALINVFFSLKESYVKNFMVGSLMPLLTIVFIIAFARVPAVRAWTDSKLEKIANRFVHNDAANSIQLVDYIGQDSIAIVTLREVPESMKGVPLSDSGLKSDNNILVMLTEHGGQKAEAPNASTVFEEGDKLTLFGDYKTICTVFNAKERFDEA